MSGDEVAFKCSKVTKVLKISGLVKVAEVNYSVFTFESIFSVPLCGTLVCFNYVSGEKVLRDWETIIIQSAY